MLFVVPITSAGALPPFPSYAARPIISPSLGIDQRAGESQRWGRERAALITSARSTERLSAQQGTRRNVVVRVERRLTLARIWLVCEDTFLLSVLVLMILLFWQFYTAHQLTWITYDIKSQGGESLISDFVFFYSEKCSVQNEYVPQLVPRGLALVEAARHFEFSALLVLQ